MADLRDPNVAIAIMGNLSSGWRIPSEQISGAQTGYVLDNNLTNPAMNPPGTCGVVVPSFSDNVRFGPIAFPGSLIPPGGGIPGPSSAGGTQCIVVFTPPSANSPSAIIGQITGFIGWPSVSGASLPDASVATPGQTFFNESTGQLNLFNGTSWVTISSGGYNSLLPIFVAA